MALYITDECISCSACLPECPNEAIFENRAEAEAKGHPVTPGHGVNGDIYVISHELCTECVGFHDQPKCAEVCPIDNCCILDPEHKESKEDLMAKKDRLHPEEAAH